MKHTLRKTIAATVASLAIIAPLPMQNGIPDLVAPITASADFSGQKQGAVAVKINADTTLYFKLDATNNTCQLCGSDINKADSLVDIPDTITKNGKTYTVTSIGPNAFRDQIKLRSIRGAKHITRIGKAAFMGCTNLYDIYLFNGDYPDGCMKGTVEHIEECAFKDCTALKDSHFLQSVKTVGAWAFWGSNIPSVFIRDAYSIGEAAFYNCTNVSSIHIYGSHLKTISDFAFYNCSKAEYIDLHNGVTTIGKTAFANCDKVETLNLPSSLKTIDTGAFMGCDKLKEVVTVNVETVKDHAFFNCPKMIRFKTGYKDTALGEYSLGFCYTNRLEKNPGFYIIAPTGGAVSAYGDANGFYVQNS